MPDAVVPITRPDHTVSGSVCGQACQAASTLAASAHAKSAENVVSGTVAKVLNVNDVTTPKLPPPPPRSAQNRSASCVASQVTTVPSASTTCADTSWSQVRP